MALPRMIKVRQRFDDESIGDIEGTLAGQFALPGIRAAVKPGERIAVAVGSRGIANLPRIVAATVAGLKRLGAEPFIVPAMGSHGGATAEGQAEVLESLGVTERTCGAPIVSSMETVQIGRTEGGMPVYMDKQAYEADGVVPVARVKLHTDFKSPIGIESGLMKMTAIGLGKHEQALALHAYGIHGIRDIMPEVARVALASGRIRFGVATVENAAEQTAMLEAVPAAEFEEREKRLLAANAAMYPRLPAEELDVLFVDRIGKNYSGTGMDTNIIGRLRIQGTPEPESPRIKYIIAGDLSEESHGNALGIGLADLTTKRLVEKIDRKAMNENVITSTFLQRAAVPITLDSDREALEAALRANWGVPPERARIARIHSTLHLERLYVSEAVYEDIRGLPNIEAEGELAPFVFDAHGNLGGWDD